MGRFRFLLRSAWERALASDVAGFFYLTLIFQKNDCVVLSIAEEQSNSCERCKAMRREATSNQDSSYARVLASLRASKTKKITA